MQENLGELESAIGYRFSNPDILVRALTHRSLANEQTQANGAAPRDNERLEFLGDAVLGLTVGEAMFLRYPDWREGELTRVRAQLVSRQHMAEVAAAVNLGKYLRLSKGEDRSGLRRKSTVLSNTMEAVLGAMFLDGGLEPVRGFVRGRVMGQAAEQLAEELRSGDALGNYKSALQEHLQGAHLGAPVYKVKSESGPDHRKRFLVEVRLKPIEGEAAKPHSPASPVLARWGGKPLARGLGSTKKLAEQDAARRALERLSKISPEADGPAPEVEESAAE